MRVSIDRSRFQAMFTEAAAVCPARSPKPVLQNVRLDASDAGITLVATNLEIGLTLQLGVEEVEEPGTVLLPAQRVGQILANDAGERIAIERHAAPQDGVRIRGAGTDFKLGTEDPATYPSVPASLPADHYCLKAAFLAKLIRRTIFATDVESTRYAFGGCLFDHDGSTLYLVGTDGRRLARAAALCAEIGKPKRPTSPVVPVRALRVLQRILGGLDPETPVQIAYDAGGSAVTIAAGPAVLHARLTEGRFPRYQDVFPSLPKTTVDVPLDTFIRATKQGAICTSDESRRIKYSFGKDTLKIEATARDVGAAAIELKVANPADPLAITFDPRYLVEGLASIGPGPACRLEMIDAKSAAVFRTDDDYTYVVMPLTTDR